VPHGPLPPRGWVAAPEIVAQEIRLLWQEEEMPEELKSSPGYATFTLSPEAQAWVDGMLEVTDHQDKRGSLVIGRPKPVIPAEHRIVAPKPPAWSDRPVDIPAAETWRESPAPPPAAKPVPPPEPKEILPRPMPQIDPGVAVPLEPSPAASTQEVHRMPEVNSGAIAAPVDGGSNQATPVQPIPQIGGGRAARADRAPAASGAEPRAFPEIEPEAAPESEGLVHGVDEQAVRAIPEIGPHSGAEDEKIEPPGPRPMPDIG
jgi:hypothetical protein